MEENYMEKAVFLGSNHHFQSRNDFVESLDMVPKQDSYVLVLPKAQENTFVSCHYNDDIIVAWNTTRADPLDMHAEHASR